MQNKVSGRNKYQISNYILYCNDKQNVLRWFAIQRNVLKEAGWDLKKLYLYERHEGLMEMLC